MAIGYKVFFKDGNYLLSACHSNFFTFSFSKDEANYPIKGHGPFAVFKSLIAAKKFHHNMSRGCHNLGNMTIYKIRYVKSRAKSLWYKVLMTNSPTNKIKSYNVVKNYKGLCKGNGINPRYADLASKITILEEIN